MGEWSMPMEFMCGRPLSAEELELIRQQIELMDASLPSTTKCAESSNATGPTCFQRFRRPRSDFRRAAAEAGDDLQRGTAFRAC
jgi:hypothetical protein